MTLAQAARRRVFYDASKYLSPCHIPNHRTPLKVTPSCFNRPNRRVRYRCSGYHNRNFSTSTALSILLPPTVFLGLVGTLWLYKCCMMILFQNKIIYMPFIPPFSRSEEIETYAAACHPVKWEERRIKSEDETELALCVGEIPVRASRESAARQVILTYFQGNGASLPPRLPDLSKIIKSLHKEQSERPIDERLRYTCVALSYRGYWRSRGSPTQHGIESDARATLKWIERYVSNSRRETTVILWGQSLGACVALKALLDYSHTQADAGAPSTANVRGIVLETPFISIREMLVALYPQKWLPYRYLWPFLRSDWDSELAFRQLSTFDSIRSVPFFMLRAANDEIVPAKHADSLYAVARSAGLDVRTRVIPNALHNEATSKYTGKTAVTGFIKETAK